MKQTIKNSLAAFSVMAILSGHALADTAGTQPQAATCSDDRRRDDGSCPSGGGSHAVMVPTSSGQRNPDTGKSGSPSSGTGFWSSLYHRTFSSDADSRSDGRGNDASHSASEAGHASSAEAASAGHAGFGSSAAGHAGGE